MKLKINIWPLTIFVADDGHPAAMQPELLILIIIIIITTGLQTIRVQVVIPYCWDDAENDYRRPT